MTLMLGVERVVAAVRGLGCISDHMLDWPDDIVDVDVDVDVDLDSE